MSEIKTLNKARKLISKDQTVDALVLLESSGSMDKNLISSLLSRCARLENEINFNTISYESRSIERNRINYAILKVTFEKLKELKVSEKEKGKVQLQLDLISKMEGINEKLSSLKDTKLDKLMLHLKNGNREKYIELLKFSVEIDRMKRKENENDELIKEALKKFNKILEIMVDEQPQFKNIANHLQSNADFLIKWENQMGHNKACKELLNQQHRKATKLYNRSFWIIMSLALLRSMAGPRFYRTTYGENFNENGYDQEGYDCYGIDENGFDDTGTNLRLGYTYNGDPVTDHRVYEAQITEGMELVLFDESLKEKIEALQEENNESGENEDFNQDEGDYEVDYDNSDDLSGGDFL